MTQVKLCLKCKEYIELPINIFEGNNAILSMLNSKVKEFEKKHKFHSLTISSLDEAKSYIQENQNKPRI